MSGDSLTLFDCSVAVGFALLVYLTIGFVLSSLYSRFAWKVCNLVVDEGDDFFVFLVSWGVMIPFDLICRGMGRIEKIFDAWVDILNGRRS